MIYQHAYDIVLDEVFLELDELTPGSSFFLKIEDSTLRGRSNSRQRST